VAGFARNAWDAHRPIQKKSCDVCAVSEHGTSLAAWIDHRPMWPPIETAGVPTAFKQADYFVRAGRKPSGVRGQTLGQSARRLRSRAALARDCGRSGRPAGHFRGSSRQTGAFSRLRTAVSLVIARSDGPSIRRYTGDDISFETPEVGRHGEIRRVAAVSMRLVSVRNRGACPGLPRPEAHMRLERHRC
jgi:hypothetical protein